MESPFFGLTLEYRLSLFTQIDDIVFLSKGSYEYDTVYNMPIWLRKFTANKMSERFEKEAEIYENAKSPNGNRQTVKIPDYVSKARK